MLIADPVNPARPTPYIRGPDVMSKSRSTRYRNRKEWADQSVLDRYGFAAASSPKSGLRSPVGSQPLSAGDLDEVEQHLDVEDAVDAEPRHWYVLSFVLRRSRTVESLRASCLPLPVLGLRIWR